MRNVADTGLNSLFQLLQNVANQPDAAQSFYQVPVLENVFSSSSPLTAGTSKLERLLVAIFFGTVKYLHTRPGTYPYRVGNGLAAYILLY